jgi:hypothetical protein
MPVDAQQLLLETYKDQIAQGRHLETQRLEVTKFILVAVAALLGLAGSLKFSIHCLPICLAIIYLGIFGKQLTKTYVERFDGHMGRARALRNNLDTTVASGLIQTIYDSSQVVKTERIRSFWIKIHNGILVVGILALIWNLGTIVARTTFQTGSIPHRLVAQLAFEDTASKTP